MDFYKGMMTPPTVPTTAKNESNLSSFKAPAFVLHPSRTISNGPENQTETKIENTRVAVMTRRELGDLLGTELKCREPYHSGLVNYDRLEQDYAQVGHARYDKEASIELKKIIEAQMQRTAQRLIDEAKRRTESQAEQDLLNGMEILEVTVSRRRTMELRSKFGGREMQRNMRIRDREMLISGFISPEEAARRDARRNPHRRSDARSRVDRKLGKRLKLAESSKRQKAGEIQNEGGAVEEQKRSERLKTWWETVLEQNELEEIKDMQDVTKTALGVKEWERSWNIEGKVGMKTDEPSAEKDETDNSEYEMW